MSGWSESRFREFLEAKFKIDPENGLNVKRVADGLSISQWTLYSILDGKIYLSPDRIVDLFNVTGDVELIRWFTRQCKGLMLVELRDMKTNGDTQDELNEIAINAGKFLEEVNKPTPQRKKLYTLAAKLAAVSERLVAEIKEMERDG